MFVIARNSSFSYRGRSVDMKQVGRELGVRYVLEGSVRRAGTRIRVTAQLIEAESGHHLWAERYDRDVHDVFAIQDEVTAAISGAILPAVGSAEQHRALRKPGTDLNVWEIYQRAIWHYSQNTLEGYEKAEIWSREACALDPSFAPAWSALARVVSAKVIHFHTGPMRQAAKETEEHARHALALDPDDPEAQASLTQGLVLQEDMGAACSSAQRILELNPNSVRAYLYIGLILVRRGQPQLGREALATALRLNPREPANLSLRGLICASYFQERDYQRCIEAAEDLQLVHNAVPSAGRWLTASLAHLGRIEEAKEAVRNATAGAHAKQFQALVRQRPPWHRSEDHEHLLDGLRKAGWVG